MGRSQLPYPLLYLPGGAAGNFVLEYTILQILGLARLKGPQPEIPNPATLNPTELPFRKTVCPPQEEPLKKPLKEPLTGTLPGVLTEKETLHPKP